MLLELQKNIIYGPVNSRRLGRSLGVNILPAGIKLCTLNCLYCQYGWTNYDYLEKETGISLPTVQDVAAALERALKALTEPTAYITFSGNGEATRHPLFEEMVDAVIDVRNQLSPNSKTAILSNSTLVTQQQVRNALNKLDVRIMKLDAGIEEVFKLYNNPWNNVSLETITAGLASVENVTIQALFTKGASGNYREDNIRGWVEKLKRISPVFVQVYTLDRDIPSDSIFRLTYNELNEIKSLLDREGIPSGVF